MSTRKFLQAAVSAATLAGLCVATAGAQTMAPRDDGSARSNRVLWLSAAGASSAALFATFLHGSHAAPTVGTRAATPAPVGTAVTTGDGPVRSEPAFVPGTTEPETSGSNMFVPVENRPTENAPALNLPSAGVVTPAVATTTPEPTSLALLATGIVGLVPLARRRRR